MQPDAPLESVLRTEELSLRSARPPDYATENRALTKLVQGLADSPHTILQTLTDTILEALRAGSAGISLLSKDETSFHWPAISGEWSEHIGGGTPRDFGPCGDVLDCKIPMLFNRLERRYSYFQAVQPAVEEALLVPFFIAGKAVGTIWVVTHNERHLFDAEDLRLLESLGRFASAAYRVVESTEETIQSHRALESLHNCFDDITGRKLLKQDLRDSSELNRSIIASSTDCIKVLDLDGNLLSMECGIDLLGIDDIGPYLNTSWINFWQSEDDRRAAQAAVESAREKAGATGNFVGFFQTLRGEPKWWDVTLSPILDASGQPVQLLAVSRDVTRQTKDANAIRENQGRMRFATDVARLTYVEVDLATGMAKVAENFAAVMGYSITHDQLHNFHVGSELLLNHIAPADRSRVEVALQQFLGGKTVGTIEYRVIGDDRIERWFESRWSIECDSDGKPLKTFAINIDVSERKQGEETVRESQQFMRSSLDALSGQIVILDESGTILEVNKAWRHFAEENKFVATNYGIGSSYLSHEVQIGPDEFGLKSSTNGIRSVIAGRLDHFELEYPCHSSTEQRWYLMRVTRFNCPGPVRVVIVHDNITERRRAEVQLRQNHNTFSQLIENAPFGLYVVDSEFVLRQVSSASKKVFQNIDPLIGRDFEEVLRLVWAEPFASEALGRFRHTLATGESYAASNTTELRYASVDIESYDWKIERVTLPDGQFGVVCYFYDISERMNSELALRASEEQYRTLFDSMDEGYCIIEMIFDEHEKPIDWRFLEVNPSFEKQTGLHGVVGKRMLSLIPDHERYWFETYGAVIRTGEPVRFVNQAKGLDDQWFDLYAFRVGEPGSHKVAVLFNNISERKKYEEALRQSERSLKFIMASMPQMITTAKPNGEIDSYNPQWLEYTGLSIEQLRGWGWKDIIHPDDVDETVRLWAIAVASGETYHRQERFLRADGEYRWHLSRAVPMKDADGQVVMWIGSNTDVHDIKEIENQLQVQSAALADLHRRKDEFLAMLSHELRSPLAPISNAIHLLRMQAHEEPLQRQPAVSSSGKSVNSAAWSTTSWKSPASPRAGFTCVRNALSSAGSWSGPWRRLTR